MKKLYYLLLLVLAVVFTNCDRKLTESPKINVKDADVVVLDHGKIKFYQSSTQTVTEFPAETDSVVNAVFSNNNILFYTVFKGYNLSLKRIELNEENPQPKFCAGWNLTLEQCIDGYLGEISDLFMVEGEDKVAIEFGDNEDGVNTFDYAATYDIATGKVSVLAGDAYYSVNYRRKNDISDLFETRGDRLYYRNGKESHCLNDNIEFFDDEWERKCIGFHPISFSPDCKWVLFSAFFPGGDVAVGPYCLASLDGKEQELLEGVELPDRSPEWLSDGSLVYIVFGETCFIRRVGVDDDLVAKCDGNFFTVRPFEGKDPVVEAMPQEDPSLGSLDVDLALFNSGELSFYNAKDRRFIPVEKETDSVVNGVLVKDKFYYSVAKDKDVFLKCVDLNADLDPVMVADWGLKVDSCITETYGDFAGLVYYPKRDLLATHHGFSWDDFSFRETRVYSLRDGKMWDWDWEKDGNIYSSEDEEEEEEEVEEDQYDFFREEEQYYYQDGSNAICLSDRMNVKQYVSDPDYATDVAYYCCGVSPIGTRVLFAAAIEAGDFDHGPLCVASLDGTFQLVLEGTDMAQTCAEWLNDGSLVYQGNGAIMILYPDKRMDVLSSANSFVVR